MFNWFWNFLKYIFSDRNQQASIDKIEDTSTKDVLVQTKPSISSTFEENTQLIIMSLHQKMEIEINIIAAIQEIILKKRNEDITCFVSKFNNFVQMFHDKKFSSNKLETNQNKAKSKDYINLSSQYLHLFKDKESLIATSKIFSLNFPTFDGTTSFTTYKEEFDRVLEVALVKHPKWTDAHSLVALIMSLQRPAAGKKILDTLFNALENHYGDKNQKYAKELKTRRQGTNEGIEEWGREVERLCCLVFNFHIKSYYAEGKFITVFMDGLRDKRIKRELMVRNYHRWEHVLDLAMELEMFYEDYDAAATHAATNKPIIRTMCHSCGELGFVKGSGIQLKEKCEHTQTLINK